MKKRRTGLLVFFSPVESYLTIVKIPKTASLVKYWTYFNEKYLRSNNFPRLLIKARYMKNDTFFKI